MDEQEMARSERSLGSPVCRGAGLGLLLWRMTISWCFCSSCCESVRSSGRMKAAVDGGDRSVTTTTGDGRYREWWKGR